MHCHQFQPRPISRRDMLRQCANGFGAVALSALAADPAYGLAKTPFSPSPTHQRRRARSVIFLYMDGGVSQVDSFDPKPRLDKEHGKPFKAKIEATQFDAIGKTLKSPWAFKRYGESGIPVSETSSSFCPPASLIQFPPSLAAFLQLCMAPCMGNSFSSSLSSPRE